jgi:hypothetical protein
MRARSGCTSTSGVFCGWDRSQVVLASARLSRPRRGWVGGEAAAPPGRAVGRGRGGPRAAGMSPVWVASAEALRFLDAASECNQPGRYRAPHAERRRCDAPKRSCCAAGDMALCAYPVRSGAECPGRTTEGLTPLWGGESFSRARIHALKGPEAAAPDLRARPNLTEPDTRVALYVPISARKAPTPPHDPVWPGLPSPVWGGFREAAPFLRRAESERGQSRSRRSRAARIPPSPSPCPARTTRNDTGFPWQARRPAPALLTHLQTIAILPQTFARPAVSAAWARREGDAKGERWHTADGRGCGWRSRLRWRLP